MVTAIVGDIQPKSLIPLLEKYFGRIPAGSPPSPIRTVEPISITEKIVILQDPSQPLYIEGYHKPAVTDVDQPVYDAIDDILTNGRTSRLFRSLVRDKQLAVSVGAYAAYPGDKYPHVWLAYGVPGRGVSNQAVQKALHEEFDKLKTQDVTDEELARFRTRAKAGLLRALNNNLGLAMHMTDYQMLFGDWRELFRYIRRFDHVTKDDIRRVAKDMFQPTNRVVGMIETVLPQDVAIPASAAVGEGQS
jgi:predicted Zn-dependent peptidase